MTQLLQVTTDLFNAIEKGTRSEAIFLGFSKAFDKVDHEWLLRKLQSVGVVGNLLRWMHYHLIVIVLDPLLFIIFINNIVYDILSDNAIRLFAIRLFDPR